MEKGERRVVEGRRAKERVEEMMEDKVEMIDEEQREGRMGSLQEILVNVAIICPSLLRGRRFWQVGCQVMG